MSLKPYARVSFNTNVHRRRTGKDRLRLKCSKLIVFIATVVLVENVLMVYNFAIDRSVATAFKMAVDLGEGVPSATAVNAQQKMIVGRPNCTTCDFNTTTVSTSATTTVVPETTALSRPMTEQLFYRKQPTKINPYVYHTRMAPRSVCRNDTRMLITVNSDPFNFDRRAAIRDTWGDAVRTGSWPLVGGNPNAGPPGWPCCKTLELVFVVGLHRDPSVNVAIEKEFLEYHDLVQGDFVDDYHNMTLKSLLGLKFALERCQRVEFLLKSDDDMIINLPYLLEVINSEMKPRPRSMIGPYNGKSKVAREGVWALTFEEFPFQEFPPYYSGASYVISAKLISELFDAAEFVPSIFIDDVYITGILCKIIGIDYMNPGGFAFWGTGRRTACEIINNKVLTGTKMHPQRLVAFWDEMMSRPNCSSAG